MMNSLRLQNVSLAYKNKDNNYEILKKLNLQFEEGKSYAILGASGSGKTSLLNCIAGLAEYSGDIYFNNLNIKEISEIDEKVYKSKIVNYLQQSSLIFENIKAKDNLKLPNLRSKYKGFKWENELLSNSFKKTKPKKMSGGEKRRLQILQLLNKNSFVVICDEPTNGLDKINSELAMGYIKEFCSNKIFIFVTHDEEIANKYADEILYLNDGKIKKNYSKKLSNNDFNMPQTTDIVKSKSYKYSFKYLSSENEYRKLLTINFSVLLICLCLFSSIISGFSNYFTSLLGSSSDQTYILIDKLNDYHQINDDEYIELESYLDNGQLKRKYILENNIETNIGGELFELDSSVFTNSCLTTETNLESDELILSINEETYINMCDIFECDDLIEYFEGTEKEILFEINNIEKTFTINKIEFDENQLENILFVQNNENFNETFFENTNTTFYTYVENDNIDAETQHFIENTQEYKFFLYDDKYFIYKNNKNTLSKEELSVYSANIIPLYSDNEEYFLKHYNGLLYFNNVTLNTEIFSVDNELIYYTPYKLDLLIGRNPESVDEIVISLSLKRKLNIPDTLGYISFNYNGTTSILNVVGIADLDENYIMQEPSWINEYYSHFLNTGIDYEKTSAYMIIESNNNINSIYDSLKKAYSEYNISSPLYETETELKSILNTLKDGSIILLSFLSFIILIIVCISRVLEKSSYRKHIKLLQDNGYTNKELNKIYFKVEIERALISIIMSLFFSIIIVVLINETLFNELGITDLLSFNYQQILLPIILAFIITFISFFFTRIRNKKNSN